MTHSIALPFLLLLAAGAAAQDAAPADPDAAIRKALAAPRELMIEETTLPGLLAIIEEFDGLKLPLFHDPVAEKDPARIRVCIESGPITLDTVLRGSLAAGNLEYIVWQGVIVVTSAKEKAAFQSTAWAGFEPKALKGQPDLAKKMSQVVEVDCGGQGPREAIEQLAKAAGLAIDASALEKAEGPGAGMSRPFPPRTTAYGALVFLSRSTGVTFELKAGGSLVANAPAKK